MEHFSVSRVRSMALLTASIFAATPALAWDVSVGMGILDNGLHVQS